MSAEDKADAAWRMVVDGELSKREINQATRVATSSVANMRKALKVLKAANRHDDREMLDWSWKRAIFEVRRLKGDEDAEDPDAAERKLRILIRKLTPAFRGYVPAEELLAAMEELRPGISIELRDVLEEPRDSVNLDV